MTQQLPQGSGFGISEGPNQIGGQSGLEQGQQGGYATQQSGQQTGFTLEEALSGEMRLALDDFVQALTVCEWCADQCIGEGPEMAECLRLCRDVANLAVVNIRFIASDSVFGPDVAKTFANAAEECARECSKHPHSHCQECATVLRRAANTTRSLLESLPRSTGQPQQSQNQY